MGGGPSPSPLFPASGPQPPACSAPWGFWVFLWPLGRTDFLAWQDHAWGAKQASPVPTPCPPQALPEALVLRTVLGDTCSPGPGTNSSPHWELQEGSQKERVGGHPPPSQALSAPSPAQAGQEPSANTQPCFPSCSLSPHPPAPCSWWLRGAREWGGGCCTGPWHLASPLPQRLQAGAASHS